MVALDELTVSMVALVELTVEKVLVPVKLLFELNRVVNLLSTYVLLIKRSDVLI